MRKAQEAENGLLRQNWTKGKGYSAEGLNYRIRFQVPGITFLYCVVSIRNLLHYQAFHIFQAVRSLPGGQAVQAVRSRPGTVFG